MDLNDKLQLGLSVTSASVNSIVKIVELLSKDPRTATIPIGELWKQLGIAERLPVLGSCLTIVYLSFWTGNAMVRYTERHHLPLPLDMVGITRAAEFMGVPINSTVAALVHRHIVNKPEHRRAPAGLGRAFGRGA